MKRIGLTGVYEWGLYAVLFFIVLHAPISVGFGTLFPDYTVGIKAWKEIILIILAFLAAVLITRRGLWHDLLQSRLMQLAVGFIIVHVVLAALLGGDARSVAAGLMIDVRFIGMFMLMYVLVCLQPKAIHRTLMTVAAGACLVLGFGLLQITVLPDDILTHLGYSRHTITPFTTIDSNPEYVRIDSTLRGPNPLGALIVVYASLALAYLVTRYDTASARRKVAAFIGVLAGGAVVFASFSRSAYIAFVAGLAVVCLSSWRLSRRAVFIVAACVIGIGLALLMVSSTDWFSNVILHEDAQSTTKSKSNQGHLQSFASGAAAAATNPFGDGVGSTGSASLYDKDSSNDAIIENYYFFVAHESGWLGFGIFTALYVLIMIELWRRRSSWAALGVFASGIGLAIIGLLLPVWADETVALIWWGMAGALIAPLSPVGAIIEDKHGRRTRQ